METEKEKKVMDDRNDGVDANEETEALEILLFQVSECYVYLIPPRKSAASYRADEWNVNKWAWEGTLKVLSKGEECIIRLEDKSTGELYARAFLRKGELHPVEPVIDSSRYFVLRIEENMDGHLRHAFIGIGFRERTEAYDFQVALHDHIKYYSIYYPYAFVLKLFVVFLSFKFLVDYAANYSNDNLMHFLTLFWRYLDKKKTAEEMEQQFRKTSTVDYSLKDGETLHLQLKNKSSGRVKSKFFEQGLNNLSLDDKGNPKEPVICIKLPPPPPASLSPGTAAPKSPSNSPPNLCLEGTSNEESPDTSKEDSKELHSPENQSTQDIPDDDFGDFQAAG